MVHGMTGTIPDVAGFVSGAVPPPPPARRHDLDALRAFAMLLGIGLHASLSFAVIPWIVQDTHQHPAYNWFFHAVHGFRMPVFFVMSGFFTAMLWRRRGMKSLLKHRFKRIFLPLCLGTVTVVPMVSIVSALAMASAVDSTPAASRASSSESGLWTAIQSGDHEKVRAWLDAGADIHALDEKLKVTPLTYAALFDEVELAALLLDAGADPMVRNQDRSTTLHGAALFGRTEIVGLLLVHGADPDAEDAKGYTPSDATRAGMGIARLVAGLCGIELEEDEVREGWSVSARLLEEAGAEPARSAAGTTGSDKSWRGVAMLLMVVPVFHHLWFLWHLCWLVAAFALLAPMLRRLSFLRPADGLVLSPARYLWLVPMTMVFMSPVSGYGPDTSTGLIPIPYVLANYAVFFGFGAVLYTYDDPHGRISQGWRWTLPLALLVVFPVGLALTYGTYGLDPSLQRLAAVFLQALYPWLMTFGLMGLFRAGLNEDRYGVRYVSDSSYWLYVAHLPLILLAQWMVRDWAAPALAKFSLICIVVTALLLVTYRYLVRYRWLGRFLNGPRARPPRLPAAGKGDVVSGGIA